MVKVIDYLIENGYVKRCVNPNDRREHFILLTTKGEEKSQQIAEAFDGLDKELLTGLADAEKKLFQNVMEQLTQKLRVLPADDLFFEYNKTKTNARKRVKSIR